MPSVRSIFRKDDEPVAANPASAEGLAVIRVEVPSHLLDADPLLLRLEDGQTRHRLLPVDLDGGADFLVPSALLAGARVVLEAGDEEIAAPRTTKSPVGVDEAYLALQQELSAQERRIDALRDDLRRERERTRPQPNA
jgi:hypothetical protein